MVGPNPDSQAASPPKGGGPDEGSTKVLEAVVLSGLVLGSVGVALSTQMGPSPAESNADGDLEQRTWGALEALDEFAYPDDAYPSQLSYLVAQAATGNQTLLADSLAQLMPQRSAFQAHLHNGFDRLPMVTGDAPEGVAVGVSYPVELEWRGHYGATGLDVYDANSTNLTVGQTLVPMFNSNLVRDPGIPVRATVGGNLSWTPGFALESMQPPQAADPNPSFQQRSYTSLIQGNQTHAYPSASIYMECTRGGGLVPCYASDLTADPRTGYGPKADEAGPRSKIGIVVENVGPGSLDAGTELRISLPVGLAIDGDVQDGGGQVAFDVENTLEIDGTSPDPETITVELGGDLADGQQAVLDVWVKRTDDRYAYKQVHATLAGGAASASQFLLVLEDKPADSYTGADARQVLVSTPRPAGSGDDPQGRWAIVLPTPVGTTNVSQASLELLTDRVSIQQASWPGDFDPSHPDSPVTDGQIQTDAQTIEWSKPVHESAAYGFVELQFNVSTVSTYVPASPAFPNPDPQTAFSGYETPPHGIQTARGLWSFQHPPPNASNDLPGYEAGTDDPEVTLEATNRVEHRNIALEGTTAYHLAAFQSTSQDTQAPANTSHPALKDALHASELEAVPHQAVPGDTVTLSINASALTLLLDHYDDIDGATMTTSIYPPQSFGSFPPTETYEHEFDSQTPPNVVPSEIEHSVAQNALLGGHVVVSEIAWEITDTAGNTIEQTARLHDTYEVTASESATSLSPTYNVEVLAWMEDW